MNIYFPNLGKSDCILIDIDKTIIMIDTSFAENAPYILEMLKQINITQIDYLILTHLDKDHIGGAPEILRNFPVVSIIQPDYKVHTPQYDAYIQALIETNQDPFFLCYDVNLSICNAAVKLLAPQKQYYEKSNDYSIITEIFQDGFSFLFMGDAEEIRINEFITNNHRTYDVIKMPHHGILVPATDDLITSTKPNYAVITCADVQTNIDATIHLLKQNNVITYLTRKGPILIQSGPGYLDILQLLEPSNGNQKNSNSSITRVLK